MGAKSIDRAIAILWLAKRRHSLDGMTTREVVSIIEGECGHPSQNCSRLHERLGADRRTAKFGHGGWRLRPDAQRQLDERYGRLLKTVVKKSVAPDGSLIPRDIFVEAGRGYLTKVVDQVNGCYDDGHYDGCAVMGRRLMETLLIEAYVQAGRALFVKDSQGSFLTLEGLIGKVISDSHLPLSRDTKRLLPEIKRLGDQSAHNPRFNARRVEIDALKHGLRVAAEELLNLCNYGAVTKGITP